MFLSQTSDGSQSALPALFPAKIQTQQPPPAGLATAVPKPMEELDLLGKALLQQALPPESQQVKWWVRLLTQVRLKVTHPSQLSAPVDAGTSFSLTPESPYESCRNPTPRPRQPLTRARSPPRPSATCRAFLISSQLPVSQLWIPMTASLSLMLLSRWNQSNPVSTSTTANSS